MGLFGLFQNKAKPAKSEDGNPRDTKKDTTVHEKYKGHSEQGPKSLSFNTNLTFYNSR